ncbi:DNA polymerase delta processivity factor (proliferating cell nuclear antigen) [Trachipleistophora hominis]|uniref:DNA sliding clamp PCNA n=1 Tax=Trachipleistophora hominis TaxID=72359 RepID=L7JTW9_TRAHO|nr:DNA polymerase delta processivity factor (proliferating cell nuclear antigen) [Trachipleistophora hominis]
MFELKIIESDKDENSTQNRTSIFRKIVESAADIVDDVDIKLNDEGVSMQFMDAMNVAMMDVLLTKNMFDEYRCDRSLTLGLKIKEFSKILKGIKLDTGTTFYLHCDDNPDTLNMVFEGEAFVSNYDMKLQNIGSECYDIPQIDFTAEAEMKCSDFLYMRKAVGNFSEYIQMNACKTCINFSQKGEIIDSNMKFKAPETGKFDMKLNVTEDVWVEIPMKYINCITKTAGFCQTVKICLGNNAPVFFEFMVGDYGHIRYYIAPKISDE